MATLTTLNAASPLDASDNTYLTFTANATETLTRALDDVNADLASMDTLTFDVEYSLTAAGDDDIQELLIRIMNGTTVLAAADSGGTFQQISANVTNTTDTNSGATSFTYVNTGASKTDWNGASVELQQIYTKNKGNDGVAIRVDHVIFDGTYTQATSSTLDAVTQTYTLTGIAADFAFNYGVTAQTQTYALTGQAATFQRAEVMVADTGSLTLTGIDAGLEYNRIMDATTASFTLSGVAAEFPLTYAVLGGAQSYTLTGVNASLEYARIMPGDVQSYTLTGQDALFERSEVLVANAGSFALSGVAADFTYSTYAYAYADADQSVGNWATNTGATTNLYQAIDEAYTAVNDSDFVRSEALPSASKYRARLSDILNADTSGIHEFSYRYEKSNAEGGRLDLTVRLIQGASTVIASWSHADVANGIVEANQTLTGPEVASITDYTDLFIEFEATAA